MKILPGTNLTFSWKRALGVTDIRRKIAKSTGIPTTKQGLDRKVGAMVIDALFGRKKS